jgi:hypothetical protein
MFERERERGIRLARLARGERDALVARLMFGRHWQRARKAMLGLIHAWGIGAEGAEAPEDE